MPYFNDTDPVEAPLISQKVFEKVRLNVAERLVKANLAALACNIRAQVVEEHLTQSILAHFHTWLLGGNFHTVRLEETVEWSFPVTWWDHLKADICDRLKARGWRTLAGRLWSRIHWRKYSKTVTKTEKVATHLCPHVAVAADHRGDLVHFSWMDGDVKEAEALKEQLKCNGRLN